MKNRHYFSLAALLVSLLVLPGCVTASRANKMEEQINELQAEQNRLADSMSTSREDFEKMLTQARGDVDQIRKVLKDATELMQRNSADFGADFSRFQQEFSMLRGKVETLAFNLEKTEKDLGLFKEDVDLRFGSLSSAPIPSTPSGDGQPGGEAVPTSPAGSPNMGIDPNTMLKQGEAFLEKGKSKEAEETFEAFIATFPDNKAMDRAIFGLGSALLAQKQARAAGKQFEKILSSYPKSEYLDDSYYNLGEVFIALGSCKNAAKFYDRVIKKFNDPKLKKMAEERMKKIEAGAYCP